MMPTLSKKLKEYKDSLKVVNKFVFTNALGQRLGSNSKVWEELNKLLKKQGYDCTLHDLRHTYASLLIAKGVNIKYIQKMLGHTSIKMTMDTYGHLIPDVHDHAVNALEEILNKNIPDRHALGTQELS